MFVTRFLKKVRSFLERFSRRGSDGAEAAGHPPHPKQLRHYAACMISRDSLPN